MDGEYLLTKQPQQTKKNKDCYLPVFEHGREGKGKLCLAMEEDGTVYYSTAPLHPSTTARRVLGACPNIQKAYSLSPSTFHPWARTYPFSQPRTSSIKASRPRKASPRSAPRRQKLWVFWLTNAKKGKHAPIRQCSFGRQQQKNSETVTRKK